MSVDDDSLGRKEKKKKTMSVDDGILGQKKKKKKTLSIDDSSLGRKRKKKRSCPSRSQNLDFKTWLSSPGFRDFDARTHKQTTSLYK
jgi:hypothetical protein